MQQERSNASWKKQKLQVFEVCLTKEWSTPKTHQGSWDFHTARFLVTGYFETSAPNDHKMTLNLQGQMYPICITIVTKSQISVLFAQRPAVFELHTILRKVHQMTPKSPWTLQGHMYLIYMLLVSPSSKVLSILINHQLFSRYRPVWDNCTEWPENDLEHYKLTILHICVTNILSPTFHSILLYDQPFSIYLTFYNSPLTTMLSAPPPKKKKNRKNVKNSKFQMSQFF